MKYCPLISFQRDATPVQACLQEACSFADRTGQCLIKQALECYISAEHTCQAKENVPSSTIVVQEY